MKKIIFLFVLSAVMLSVTSLGYTQHTTSQNTPVHSFDDLEPIIAGRKFKFYSKVLGEEKEIYISLPENYKERNYDYPVIYAVEAEYLFEITRTITKTMEKRNEIPQSIVIGVANIDFKTRNEMTIPTHGGRVADHLKFFKTELIPYIEANYRANAHRTIIGMSPTTGLVFEGFWSDPEIFTHYIALTTHLTWPPRENVVMIDKIIQTITDPKHPKGSIYLGIADSDIARTESQTAAYEDAANKLKTVPITNVRYKLDALQGEEHYGMALTGLRNALKHIYPNGKTNNIFRYSDDPIENMKRHYDDVSMQYGFPVRPIEIDDPFADTISAKASAFLRWKQNKNSLDWYSIGVAYYPNSAKLHMGRSDAYLKNGMKSEAIKSAKEAVRLAEHHQLPMSGLYRQKLLQIEP